MANSDLYFTCEICIEPVNINKKFKNTAIARTISAPIASANMSKQKWCNPDPTTQTSRALP
ncbi:hypothetical protein CCACVL1_08280 [Corchorus capsularis]|uniref:Uncharacterized protein n=1 Tax=Corchorus capsularis TaxID=210143 RepID=A0A1R3J1K8_COCAP|nr:hypothetical protein CCACVL1_08280 [Corchorus capsularis]